MPAKTQKGKDSHSDISLTWARLKKTNYYLSFYRIFQVCQALPGIWNTNSYTIREKKQQHMVIWTSYLCKVQIASKLSLNSNLPWELSNPVSLDLREEACWKAATSSEGKNQVLPKFICARIPSLRCVIQDKDEDKVKDKDVDKPEDVCVLAGEHQTLFHHILDHQPHLVKQCAGTTKVENAFPKIDVDSVASLQLWDKKMFTSSPMYIPLIIFSKVCCPGLRDVASTLKRNLNPPKRCSSTSSSHFVLT